MKKPFNDMHGLAIEFVEFDDQDKPKASSFTPLGNYLHETQHSPEEQELTAKLAALAAER